MEHFCTLFDSGFFAQGMLLDESLKRHASPCVLWILCMDEAVEEKIKALNREGVKIIPLREFETPALAALRSNRNRGEYCWTLTPFLPKWILSHAPEVVRVTYVDADLFFLRSPRPVFQELEASGKSVLITEHAYAPEYDQSLGSGRFCVQFVVFCRGAGETVCAWWADRCAEWCHDRIEEGRFGDQKYLDDWPERFPDQVHVLRERSSFLAPWNATRFPYSEAVAWHFHGLRLLAPRRTLLFYGYRVPKTVIEDVYRPYVRALGRYVDRATPFHRFPLSRRLRMIAARLKRVVILRFREHSQILRD